MELWNQSLLTIGIKKVLWVYDSSTKGLYTIMRVVSTNDVERILDCKISKHTWEYMERKQDDNLF